MVIPGQARDDVLFEKGACRLVRLFRMQFASIILGLTRANLGIASSAV